RRPQDRSQPAGLGGEQQARIEAGPLPGPGPGQPESADQGGSRHQQVPPGRSEGVEREGELGGCQDNEESGPSRQRWQSTTPDSGPEPSPGDTPTPQGAGRDSLREDPQHGA